jgi:hypothetical protein
MNAPSTIALCLVLTVPAHALADEVAASAAATEEVAAPAPAPAPATPTVTVSGGAYLWHYEPLLPDAKNNTELYAAWIDLDTSIGDFGFHFEPRFRDSKLRPYYNSNFWVQEVYASWKSPAGVLKVGKLYSRFGRFWDASFYGNLSYFDGIKLDPDVGVSFEGTQPIATGLDLEYAAQYFIVDGLTNGSLQDRDTVSVPGGRQRNGAVARVATVYKPVDPWAVTAGLSGQRFEADFDAAKNDDVMRVGAELDVALGPASVYGEYIHQKGFSVANYPAPAMASEDNDYWQVGAQGHWRWLAARYNLSAVTYNDVSVTEVLHQPGVTVTVNEKLSLLTEYIFWRRYVDEGTDVTMDKSLNFIVYAAF